MGLKALLFNATAVFLEEEEEKGRRRLPAATAVAAIAVALVALDVDNNFAGPNILAALYE